MHRDICPENIFLSRDFVAVIANFAKSRMHNEKMTKIFSATTYNAPERSSTEHSYPADIFSLGCVYFEQLTLKNLFSTQDIIQRKLPSFTYPSLYSGPIAEQFIELIKQMVSFDPSKRPTIQQVLNHRIFVDFQEKSKPELYL